MSTVKDDSQLRILTNELEKWNCDILGVAETHRHSTEQLCLNGYKFIAQGVEEDTSRSGVGMFLSKNAQKAFIGYNPVSDQTILARLKTMIGYSIVIQIYAPTTDVKQQEVDSFYSLLQATLNEHKDNESVIVMGDFNAKVSTDWENSGAALGRFGIGDANEAGERLIQFATANSLVITNTCFRQAKANRQ